MPFVDVDRITDLDMEEDRGVIKSLTRLVLVEFSNTEIATNRDFSVLQKAMVALNAAGLTPNSTPFSTTAAQSVNYPFIDLYLTKRTPRVKDGDPQYVEVRLRYDHVTDSSVQALDSKGRSLIGKLAAKGRCSIVEKTTNFFYPHGDTRCERQLIEVAHTFPVTDPSAVVSRIDPDLPRTGRQVGEISIPFPQANITIPCLVKTLAPYALARQMIRHINSQPWNGEKELTWLCSEVSWELLGYPAHILPDTASYYTMTFEFQYNSDGWDPFVVYNDQRIGRPPSEVLKATLDSSYDAIDAGAVVATYNVFNLNQHPETFNNQPAGAWNVPALPRKDFQAFFGAAVDGM